MKVSTSPWVDAGRLVPSNAATVGATSTIWISRYSPGTTPAPAMIKGSVNTTAS